MTDQFSQTPECCTFPDVRLDTTEAEEGFTCWNCGMVFGHRRPDFRTVKQQALAARHPKWSKTWQQPTESGEQYTRRLVRDAGFGSDKAAYFRHAERMSRD